MAEQSNEKTSGFQQPNSSSTVQKTMTDLLALPDAERTLMTWLVRQRHASFADILTYTETDSESVQRSLQHLLQNGFLTVSTEPEGTTFRPNLVSRKTRALPKQIWDTLS